MAGDNRGDTDRKERKENWLRRVEKWKGIRMSKNE